MPRRGWSDAPAEWVQIVRGPRPKSVKLPTARGQSSAQPAGGNQTSVTMVRGRRASQDGVQRQEGERGLPPDEVLANARARVTKLEAVIAAVGDSDPISATLKEALSRAKSEAQERPNIFIERVKKRVVAFQQDVTNAQAAVVQAQEKLAMEEALLRDGEVRLQALMHEASNPMECQDVPPTIDEIAQLKARWVAAEEERDAALRSNSSKRQATMPRMGVHTRTDHILPMPTLVPAELSQWLLDRQSDLQETLELGGSPDLVLQLTSMLSDGAVRMMEMNGGMVP